MRKLAILLLPFFLFGTSAFTHRKLPAKIHSVPIVKNFDPEDWIIDERTARRMMNFYVNCHGNQCHQFKKQTLNNEAREYLEQMYTIVDSTKLMGRYDYSDVARYMKARRISPGENRGKVSGYSTIITRYTVMPKGGGALLAPLSFKYADNYTICPPPTSPPCD